MITQDIIDNKITEYYKNNGKLPKYVLIDKLSHAYLSRILKPKEKAAFGPLSDAEDKISAIGASVGGIITILTIECNDEFLDVVS